VPESEAALVLGRTRGDLVFEDVSFGYESSEPLVLRNVSFEANRGQITAIVGVTGAGKTSLLSLLSRFYDPSSGRILLDGRDLRDLSLRTLRENVSLVLQEPFLFPLSGDETAGYGVVRCLGQDRCPGTGAAPGKRGGAGRRHCGL